MERIFRLLSPSSETSYLYVDNRSALEVLLDNMQKAQRIALDTEADSLHHYYEKVCLIQLTINSKNFIVDPLADIDLSEFMTLLSQKPLIFHGADYDLRMLYAWNGFKPASEIFDTMLAAQLLGLEHLGLVAIVEKFLNVTLSKTGQKSDWADRPLTQTQLEYACNDTRYLDTLADRLAQELERLGRLSWHRETCERLTHAVTLEKEPPDPDKVWRIRGISSLHPQQLEFVKQLWHWRQAEAQQADRPPFKIMSNHLMIELAVWLAHGHDLRQNGGPKLPRNCTNHRFKNLENAVNRAKNTTSSQWPQHPKQRKFKPFEEHTLKIFDKMYACCAQLANDLKLPASLIASRAVLLAIAKENPLSLDKMVRTGCLMQWQADLLRPAFEDTK